MVQKPAKKKSSIPISFTATSLCYTIQPSPIAPVLQLRPSQSLGPWQQSNISSPCFAGAKVQCSANGNDVAADQGECLERQGHDCFERRGEIPAILESALSHILAGGTTALLNPKSEFMKPLRPGSSSCTLMKNAKVSYGPTSRSCGSLPSPAPSAWKILAKMSQDPAGKQGTRRSFLCQFENPVGLLALPAHACGPQCASLTGLSS
jgi:hypothetical protein